MRFFDIRISIKRPGRFQRPAKVGRTKTACDPEQCPQEPLTSSGNPNNGPLEGRDPLLDLVLGRLLLKSEQTPSHARAIVNQGASFISARTVQTASDLKPYLKSITENSATRGNFQHAKACDLLVDVAEKAQLTPDEFAKLQKRTTNQVAAQPTFSKTPKASLRNGPPD